MVSQLFRNGGGAGIGSFIIVIENGILLNPSAEKVRASYDNGENLYLSIIDDITDEALLPLTGYVDDNDILHLSGRDFDDAITYEFTIDTEIRDIHVEKINGITLGGTVIDSTGSIEIDYASIAEIDEMFDHEEAENEQGS